MTSGKGRLERLLGRDSREGFGSSKVITLYFALRAKYIKKTAAKRVAAETPKATR